MASPEKMKLQSEAVFDELKNQILGGDYPPGSSLPSERSLSEVLGVHRSTVREAIRRLEQIKLVSTNRGGGSKIQDFKITAGLELLPSFILETDGGINSAVILHLIEMREDLLPIIIGHAIKRNSETLAESLAVITDKMHQSDDIDTIQVLCIEYWDSVINSADNMAYRLTFNTLHDIYRRFGKVIQEIARKELVSIESYEGIRQAVQLKDTDSAKSIARELLKKSTDEIAAAAERYQETINASYK